MIIVVDSESLINQEKKNPNVLSKYSAKDKIVLLVEKDGNVPIEVAKAMMGCKANMDFVNNETLNSVSGFCFYFGVLFGQSCVEKRTGPFVMECCVSEKNKELLRAAKEVIESYRGMDIKINDRKNLPDGEGSTSKAPKTTKPRKKKEDTPTEPAVANGIEYFDKEYADEQDAFLMAIESVLNENDNPALSELLNEKKNVNTLKDIVRNASDKEIGFPTLLSVHFGKEKSEKFVDCLKCIYDELKRIVQE